MRVLYDVVHPAHVHFYRHLYRELEAEGAEQHVVARDKEVTCELLDHFGIPYEAVGRSGDKGAARQAQELFQRDRALVRAGRKLGADLVLTRNPAGVQAAWLLRATGVFDTDDGRAAGTHFRAAAPFARVITTPDTDPDDYGAKHRRYAGYKALAYLHPDRFEPDPGVLDELGLEQGEPYFVVRFVAMVAVHDTNEVGLDLDDKRRLIAGLSERGRVVVTSEGALPDDLEPLRLRIPAHRAHDALAFARLYVGDSQTMAAEAAILGTPSFRCSSWTGRLSYLDEMEERYELVRSFRPEHTDRFIETVIDAAGAPGLGDDWGDRRRKMLADKVDVTAWYLDLVHELTAP